MPWLGAPFLAQMNHEPRCAIRQMLRRTRAVEPELQSVYGTVSGLITTHATKPAMNIRDPGAAPWPEGAAEAAGRTTTRLKVISTRPIVTAQMA